MSYTAAELRAQLMAITKVYGEAIARADGQVLISANLNGEFGGTEFRDGMSEPREDGAVKLAIAEQLRAAFAKDISERNLRLAEWYMIHPAKDRIADKATRDLVEVNAASAGFRHNMAYRPGTKKDGSYNWDDLTVIEDVAAFPQETLAEVEAEVARLFSIQVRDHNHPGAKLPFVVGEPV